MTPHDFCHWLDGYLAGAEKPDAEVIKAKAREIAPASIPWNPLNPIPVIGPGYWSPPIYGPVRTAPAFPDNWPNGTIICGQAQ